MRKSLALAIVLVGVAGFSAWAVAGDAVDVQTAADITVSFVAETGGARITHREYGLLLDDVRARLSTEAAFAPAGEWTAAAVPNGLVVSRRDGLKLSCSVGAKGQVTLRAEGAKAPVVLSARCGLPLADTIPAMLAGPKYGPARVRPVVIAQLGAPEVPGAESLFDRRRDLALTAGPEGLYLWKRGDAGWRLETAPSSREAAAGEQPALLSLQVTPHYYRDRMRIAFYEPMKKPARWPTAPVLCMTWYGTHDQRLENLKPHIDWAAQHMLPYAGPGMVFQLDAMYPDDDAKMRGISDYIRSKGIVPGIWFVTHRIVPKGEETAHPEWFVHDKDGKPFNTFAEGFYRERAPMLNTANAEVVEKHFAPWWRRMSETWNFDYFKIDGEPDVVRGYKQSVDGGGVESYRRSLKIARQIVGEEKYINGCQGPVYDGVGLFTGCRSGGDSGHDAFAWGPVLGRLFLNNIVWYSDPDSAANQWNTPVGRARVNALARVLTGQQFITDDLWTKVPDPVRRVWQQSFPMLDIRPVILDEIAKPIEIYDLRAAGPWGTRDIVGVCNYGKAPARRTLDLGLLPLGAPSVHVFDYWADAYLGKSDRTAKLEFDLGACDGKVLALTPVEADGRPTIVSTSRHLTQGALEIRKLSVEKAEGGWRVAGTSSHLVKDDPYDITFGPGPLRAVSAKASSGTADIRNLGELVRVRIVPGDKSEIDWEVSFR